MLIVVVQAVLLTRAWNRRGEEQESAIKYRYLKLVPDSVLQKVLFRTDSLFQEQGEGFRKKVLKDEARLHEQWMLQRQIEQKENEVKHLKERARKKY